MPLPRPEYNAAILKAQAAVITYLSGEPTGRQFGDLMGVCGLMRGQFIACDERAVAHDRVLDRALKNLARNGRAQVLSDRAWHLT